MTLFESGALEDLTFLTNRDHWVFDDAEARYTICLVAACRAHSEERLLPVRGPFVTLERFLAGTEQAPVTFSVADALTWTDSAALPLLPSEGALASFAQLRKSPRLDTSDGDQWRARPYRELDATNDRGLMDLKAEDCPKGFWPVFKGESFDIWQPDTGTYYAWADPEAVMKHLQDKRVSSARNRRSPFSEFTREWLGDPATLPCLHPRIAFRDVTRATDTRTTRVALIPPNVFLTHKAPFILWPSGDARDTAYLLGVLSSMPLDWYARRFVELGLTYDTLNAFPVPRPSRDDPLWQRVVQLAGRLAAPDERFADWAGKVGVDWGPLGDQENEDMIHELDAVVAHLYGLTEAQLTHIFETFHEGWDCHPRLRQVLRHYREWA